jgi:hypothetical protein
LDTVSLSAFGAVVPDVVARERLTRANSWLQGSSLIASDFVGVAAGSALFVVAAALPFTVDAVTFGLAAVLLSRLDPLPAVPSAAGGGARSLLRDIRLGAVWLWRHRLLRTLCLLIGLTNVAEVGVLSIAVLFALQVLTISPAGYGLLMVVIAAGGVLGLAITPVVAKQFGLGRTLQVAFAIYPWPFLVTAFTSRTEVAGAAFFVVGVVVGLTNVATASIRQLVVPRHLYGRAGAAFRWIAVGLGPVGGVGAGLIAARFGLHAPFLAAAGVLAVAMVIALRSITNAAVAAAERDAASAPPATVAGPTSGRRAGGSRSTEPEAHGCPPCTDTRTDSS